MSRAFTLLELLAVIAIIAILTAVSIPALGYVKSQAHSAKCLGNLRQIGVGLSGYLADHDLRMPALAAARASLSEDVPTIDSVLLPYVGDARVFACPADPGLFQATGTSYYWNSTLNGQSAANLNFLNLVTDLTRIPVLVDKEGWHQFRKEKVNHLFADGHSQNQFRLFSNP